MTGSTDVTRELGMIEFHRHPADALTGIRRWLARSQNFTVEWVEADAPDAVLPFASTQECMVLTFGKAASIASGSQTVDTPPRSVCIVPAGAASVHLQTGGTCVVLASQRDDLAARTGMNEADFAEADLRIAPSLPAFGRRDASTAVRVIDIDNFQAPASNPRLKMLQSATLSINWVEYTGLRDRRALSPHSHADLEQGSLAVSGRFVHHLRQRWGKNADLWHDDRHIEVGSPSLMVVPVNLIHTSEGIGPEHHLLIDVFSPPRRDFIAKGWVENAADYVDPALT